MLGLERNQGWRAVRRGHADDATAWFVSVGRGWRARGGSTGDALERRFGSGVKATLFAGHRLCQARCQAAKTARTPCQTAAAVDYKGELEGPTRPPDHSLPRNLKVGPFRSTHPRNVPTFTLLGKKWSGTELHLFQNGLSAVTSVTCGETRRLLRNRTCVPRPWLRLALGLPLPLRRGGCR